MITGKPRKIKQYRLIEEGGRRVKPEVGEEIVGMPYQWYTDLSFPFIEHRKGDLVTKTVNIFYVSEIEFDEELFCL